MSKKILVLGATGIMGQPVVNSLAEKNYRVRILARNAEKARQLFPDSVEICRGNAANREDIRQALEECNGVHISLPRESELVAAGHIADLAKEAALERITYISATAASRDNCWFKLIDIKMRTEEVIRQSGLPYTFFRPTWAIDSLSNFVRGRKAMVISGKNPPPIHFVAAADLGRIVAESYGDSRALGKALYIHGPEGITLTDALERFISACHPEAPVMRLKLWQARLLARIVVRLRYVTELIAFYDRVGEQGDPAEANALFGPPSVTIDEWIMRRTHPDKTGQDYQ